MTARFSSLLEQLVHTRGIQYDLSRMEQALTALDHPERISGIIHVAGTNGKGTTSDFIAQILEYQGYRVGLYTSPHLMSYTERYRINGVPIDETTLQRYLDALVPLIDSLLLTEFEVLTLIAWQHFKDERTDFVVIETGLGGRLDATVLCSPLVTVLTSISLDHVDILGPTLLDIAKEKAGILKPRTPCFLLDQEPEVINVISTLADQQDVSLHTVPRANGSYLQTNWGLAVAVATHLLPNLTLPAQAAPRIGGRQEVLRTSPTIIADAAHNLEGIQALVDILKETHFQGSIWYSATRRPELPTIFNTLTSITKKLVIFEFPHPRAAIRNDYPKTLPSHVQFISLIQRDSFIRKALTDSEGQICLTGSIYFLGEMIPLLRQEKPVP